MSENSQNSVNLAQELTETVQSFSKSILTMLTAEQLGALESKYNALDTLIRSNSDAKYPELSIVERYIVRQMVREANGKLASNKRPIWFSTLQLNAASFISKVPEVKAYGEAQLRELAESIDSKESTTLLKKFKNSKDLTTKDQQIIDLCGIFGISPDSLK